MSEIKALQEERKAIHEDVISNRIPKRVPVSVSLNLEVVAQYGDVDLVQAQWNSAVVEPAADRICSEVYSDICVFGGSIRFPSYYQILKSQSFQMASNGFIQHPEVIGMLPEEYDCLIESPYDCIVEKIIPRQYKALGNDGSFASAISFTKSLLAYSAEFAQWQGIKGRLVEKYGYYSGEILAGGFSEAPFDFVADQLRGFRGISMDVRRMPDKVKEACDAVYPIMLKRGIPAYPKGSVFLPLHMPTFMREKDFAELWWPSFKRMVDEYASMGYHCKLLCEHDWMRYLDYLYDLPTDTMMTFELGDPRLVKEKLGKKHVIMGMYPIMNLKTKSRQENVDEVKRYLDILAPGGKYIFGFDKNPLLFSDISLENLKAVTETARDYGVYTNAGDTAGLAFRKEDYRAIPWSMPKSKYYTSWEDFRAENPEVSEFGKPRIQGLENTVFNYLVYLLL